MAEAEVAEAETETSHSLALLDLPLPLLTTQRCLFRSIALLVQKFINIQSIFLCSIVDVFRIWATD